MDGVDRALASALQLFDAGRWTESEAICRSVLGLTPDDPDAWHLLGALSFVRGAPAGAVTPILRGLALAPGRAVAHNTLGCAQSACGRLDEAVSSHSRALLLNPNYAEAASNLGASLKRLGNLEGALAACQRAVELAPGNAGALLNWGAVLDERGDYSGAADAFREALAADPASPGAAYNLARALAPQGQLGAALSFYSRALALGPDMAEAHLNHGNTLLAMGDAGAAVGRFRKMLQLAPDNAAAHSNLLFAMAGQMEVDTDSLYAECRRWEARHARPHYGAIRPHDNDRDPDRMLRIGYLSADFRLHPVANSIDGLYSLLDPSQFLLYGYAEVRKPDQMTAELRSRAHGWRSTVGIGDAEVAETIRADRIDILVCMAGHTADSRLGVTAFKPAPIQVSFADVCTSGLDVMDYRLTDSVLHAPQCRERSTETLVELPVFATQRPPADAPAPGTPPVFANGYVTFGSCNNLGKLNATVIATWARVLRAVPNSRLLLKYINRLSDPAVQARFNHAFAQHGIASDRLLFGATVLVRSDHLQTLNDVDIALDPFPFNGCTTTFEALWMGVPVVALAGDRFVGRMSEAMLARVGLGDLVAPDLDGYVDVAVRLAADPQRLAEFRRRLRQDVAASPVCDAEGYARAAGAAFRQMWRDWCHRQRG